MLPYISLVTVCALASLGEASTYIKTKRRHIGLGIFFILLAVFGGFRYEVGSDWGQYLLILNFTASQNIDVVLARSEPGYMFLNYLAVQTGGGIAFVNLVCSAISAAALFSLSREQVRPWLAAFIIFTTIFVLVVMGLSRQGVAVSVASLAIHRLAHGERVKFLALIAFATLFHSSAILLFGLLGLALRVAKVWKVVIFIVAAAAFLSLTLFRFNEYIMANYIEYGRNSSGAIFRFSLHVTAALTFLAFSKRMKLLPLESLIYRTISFGVIILALGIFVLPSSTLLDRLAFYAYILHIIVYTRLPNSFKSGMKLSPAVLTAVIFIYSAQFFVWLNVGETSNRFLPYQTTWFGMNE